MRGTVHILCCMLTMISFVSSRAEDWVRFRGSNGQGVSHEVGLPTTWSASENVAWKTPHSRHRMVVSDCLSGSRVSDLSHGRWYIVPSDFCRPPGRDDPMG